MSAGHSQTCHLYSGCHSNRDLSTGFSRSRPWTRRLSWRLSQRLGPHQSDVPGPVICPMTDGCYSQIRNLFASRASSQDPSTSNSRTSFQAHRPSGYLPHQLDTLDSQSRTHHPSEFQDRVRDASSSAIKRVLWRNHLWHDIRCMITLLTAPVSSALASPLQPVTAVSLLWLSLIIVPVPIRQSIGAVHPALGPAPGVCG